MSRLKRPLRAQRDQDQDSYDSDSDAPSVQPVESPTAAAAAHTPDEEEEDTDNSEDEDMNLDDDDEDNLSQDEASQDEEVQSSLRTISFGALATAQDSLHTRSRPSSSSNPTASTRTDGEKVSALRSRLAELKALKSSRNSSTKDTANPSSSSSSIRHQKQHPSDKPPTRSSKHAPTEQTSKRQVSRFRPVVADLSSNPTHIRDPRFTPSALLPAETEKHRRNYAFLSTYRDAELETLKTAASALKAAAKKRKSNALTPAEEQEKERLLRAINAIENRGKAERKREAEREIVRGHRRGEREKVKAGKAPFFLKRSEVKRKALTEQWEGMRGRERDRAVKRRRKKLSERERRAMPGERRERDG